jgi:hypothetical protein
MEQDTTYVAFDGRKRKLVAAILRPDARDPEEREFPKDPHLIRRFFRPLTRDGAVRAYYEAGVSGYDLYRQIEACGGACAVVAPALTPAGPGSGSRPIGGTPGSWCGCSVPASSRPSKSPTKPRRACASSCGVGTPCAGT